MRFLIPAWHFTVPCCPKCSGQHGSDRAVGNRLRFRGSASAWHHSCLPRLCPALECFVLSMGTVWPLKGIANNNNKKKKSSLKATLDVTT